MCSICTCMVCVIKLTISSKFAKFSSNCLMANGWTCFVEHHFNTFIPVCRFNHCENTIICIFVISCLIVLSSNLTATSDNVNIMKSLNKITKTGISLNFRITIYAERTNKGILIFILKDLFGYRKKYFFGLDKV